MILGHWGEVVLFYLDRIAVLDGVMYASDYPFNVERDGSVRRFLDTAPITNAERECIAFRNWEKLVADIRR